MPVEKILDTLTDDTTFSDRTKKILSIIFLIAAFFDFFKGLRRKVLLLK
jgi:hypothetical protein